MANGGSSGGQEWLNDGVQPYVLDRYRWDVEYDDVASTVTLVATCQRFTADGQGGWTLSGNSLPGSARLWAILQNGQEWPGADGYDVLPVVNQGPQVTNNVRLKSGTGKGGVTVINIRSTASRPTS
jgi:hypothetical protein